VQAAVVLARPIPTYGEGIGIEGKGEHHGGFAWVGEKYKPERVTIPGMAPFIVDKPTLLNLPAKSQVMPIDANNMVMDLGGSAMQRGMQMVNSWPDNSSWQIVEALNTQTGRLERSIRKSQRKIQSTINLQVDVDWGNYVQTKIIGRR